MAEAKQKAKSLSRQMIAECGVHLARQTSLADLSIRKIAQALDVSPMAIYRHYRDKNALLEAMLDCFILQSDVLPESQPDWQQWLFELGMNMYKALCESPSWIPLFGQLQLKPGALAVLEAYLTQMLAAGFTQEQAGRGFFALLQNVVGAAILQQGFLSPAETVTESFRPDLQAYPLVKSAFATSGFTMGKDSMENGLRLLIDGLARELKYKIVWKKS
jgi:TetR/AcrR family tetracycline transcriptional repressor